MKVAYVAHPVSGDVALNIARAKRWIRWLVDYRRDIAYIAPWITDVEILDDNDPREREMGLQRDAEIIRRCDLFVMVGGRVSSGMDRERSVALDAGLEVLDYTKWGDEPPPEE